MKLYLIAVLFLAAVVLPSFAEEINGATTSDAVQESDLGGGGGNGATTGDEPGQEDIPEEKEEEEDIGEDNEEPQEEPKQEDIPEELKDEVEEVKRRRRYPQISVRSCRILKRYGYCKTNIKHFCISTCRCADKLSRQSCNLLRIKYRQCPGSIGRFYCPRTCKHCGPKPKPLPLQCRRYAWLNDFTRRQSYTAQNRVLCDRNIVQRWYRFGAQGKVMPTKCVPVKRCGTHATGWQVGANPRIRGQTLTRKVCFHWNRNCCRWNTHIQVTNCGSFYVYFLRKTPNCSLRYCGIK